MHANEYIYFTSSFLYARKCDKKCWEFHAEWGGEVEEQRELGFCGRALKVTKCKVSSGIILVTGVAELNPVTCSQFFSSCPPLSSRVVEAFLLLLSIFSRQIPFLEYLSYLSEEAGSHKLYHFTHPPSFDSSYSELLSYKSYNPIPNLDIQLMCCICGQIFEKRKSNYLIMLHYLPIFILIHK